MNHRITPTILLLSALVVPSFAYGDDEPIRNWWRDTRPGPRWGAPCEVKYEAKDGEYKREVQCRKGEEPPWRGTWKEEFRDEGCKVKLEATRSKFKEEVKCERS